MAESVGKLTRAQERARHAYRRALKKAIRDRAKGTGWRSTGGAVFRERAGWFLGVTPSVYINREITTARVVVKPMAIDPIFWDIVGLPENRDLPLSFRLDGAWICTVPVLAEPEIEEDLGPSIVADRLLAVADKHLDLIIGSYSMEDFLASCQAAIERYEGYLSGLVATLIVMSREEEALAICEAAQANGHSGGFGHGKMTFPDMAIAWMRRSLSGATRH